MIVTVTLNAALDVTYAVDRLEVNRTNRVRTVSERAGGKGVNVARVLQALGEPVMATGFAGGDTGRRVREGIADAGMPDALFDIAGETRRTVAVVAARGDATLLNEPGPFVSGKEWSGFVDHLSALLSSADAGVMSGSLPLGVPEDAYAILGERANAQGVPFIVDTEGAPLRAALRSRPAMVKPNIDELERTTGTRDIDAGAHALRSLGAGAVVVSAGADGLVAVTQDGVWMCRPPERLGGNPTGAGDALVAALARGLVHRNPWPQILTDAVALSAATVVGPVAGAFDEPTYRRMVRVARANQVTL